MVYGRTNLLGVRGALPYKKDDGALLYLLGLERWGLVPLWVFSLERSQWDLTCTFKGIEPKTKMTGKHVLFLELVPLRGEKSFKPHPQINVILAEVNSCRNFRPGNKQ